MKRVTVFLFQVLNLEMRLSHSRANITLLQYFLEVPAYDIG